MTLVSLEMVAHSASMLAVKGVRWIAPQECPVGKWPSLLCHLPCAPGTRYAGGWKTEPKSSYDYLFGLQDNSLDNREP